MLLRVPAASLKDLKGYGEQLNSYGYPYYEVATRISFDVQESFPKFVFSAIKPLDEKDVKFVSELRTDKRVTQLLNEAVEQKSAPVEEAGSDVPSSPFEEPPAGKATTEAVTAAASGASSKSTKAPAATATKTATATKAPAKATTQTVVSEVPEDDDVTSEGNAPKSFDALLDDIL
jgi:hypothetical protein